MSLVDDLLKQPPYRTPPAQRNDLFRAALRESLAHHCAQCPPFARWYLKQGVDPAAEIEDPVNLPFLPVSIFKRLNLQSIEQDKVVRLLKSSATSSQTPSRVVLDAITRDRQTRSLAALMGALIGPLRRPFLVLDAPPAAGTALELSARVAGMRGYLMMASEAHYVLESRHGELVLDVEKLRGLLGDFSAKGLPVCLLGYTYVLYRHVVVPLLQQGLRLELPPQSFVLHFGGWKRLEQHAVDRGRLNYDVEQVFAMDRPMDRPWIHDIYGFTEHLGIIYPDNGQGVRLAPAYAEVFTRDPMTLEALPDGVPGLLQFVSPLPHSYPGVSVLLDDMGRIVSRNREEDGRCGTRFEVLGRARGAEIRGCGDTLPDQIYAPPGVGRA